MHQNRIPSLHRRQEDCDKWTAQPLLRGCPHFTDENVAALKASGQWPK